MWSASNTHVKTRYFIISEKMDKSTEKLIRELYNKSPSGLSTVSRLYKETRRLGIAIKKKRLRDLMRKWETFTKFRIKYKIPRLRDRAVVTGPNHIFQIDLCMMPKYRGYIALLIW